MKLTLILKNGTQSIEREVEVKYPINHADMNDIVDDMIDTLSKINEKL